MTDRSIAGATRQVADRSATTVALVAAVGLMAMAVLAPFAQFGVLASLIVPTDAAATTSNIAGSIGLFSAAIAAFLVVAILDIVVAWGMYRLLRPVDARVGLIVAWLRVAYAAAFAAAAIHLIDVAQLLNGASPATPQSGGTHAVVADSLAAFRTGWDQALVIFGLHLVGLGALVIRSAHFPRVLGGLVVLAGIGYLVDSLGRLLVPGYDLTVSTVTFVGEALLIVWLFKLAIKGSPSSEAGRAIEATPVVASQAAVS